MTGGADSHGVLVSAIIPAFNAQAWIAEAVKSVLAQTWQQIEVVVVDDGSQDQTANVVRSISDPRVTLIRQDNCGAAAARNRGLEQARGAFIQFLDADDLISEQKIQKQIEALQQAPVGSVASCAWCRFTTDPKSAVARPEPVWEVSDPVAWLTGSLSGAGMMQPGAWLMPRAVIDAAGPWEESLSLHDDGEFFTRALLKAARIVFVPGPAVLYRETPGSLSRRRSRGAMESALAVCRSRHRHLLAAKDDRLVRRALATQYAQFAYEFAAAAPDLTAEALQEMRGLHEAPAYVIGGKKFRGLSRAVGMSRALRARSIVSGITPSGNTQPLDVLLVLRSCAEHYPPTVNQANMLAEAGLRVGLIDLTDHGTPEASARSIRRYRVHRMWNSKLERPYPLWKRWMNWLRFHRACQNVIRQARPRVVIAYDTLGSLFVPPTPRRYHTVYHFHELSGPEAGEGFGPRRARLKAAQSSRHVDLVVFPDADRARIFQERAALGVPPTVVMNCPRRMATVPGSSLRQRLAGSGPSGGSLVCYLGSIGADQGLVEAAYSMRYWPTDSVLVLIGGASDSMKKRILDAAASVDAAVRVRFLGLHPHAEALALAAGADLGLALIQPNNESWLYSAGAINKRFEYMALGLPQVTNNGPGVSEIIEANQCGLCVNSREPAAIGAAVRQLLDSAERRRSLSQNARARHLERFNYESQFAGVAEWIRSRCPAADAEKVSFS